MSEKVFFSLGKTGPSPTLEIKLSPYSTLPCSSAAFSVTRSGKGGLKEVYESTFLIRKTYA